MDVVILFSEIALVFHDNLIIIVYVACRSVAVSFSSLRRVWSDSSDVL